MLFIALFIGGNGCRKDIILLDDSGKSRTTKRDLTYKPYFETVINQNNGFHADNQNKILAPLESQLIQLGKDLGNVKWGTLLSKKVAQIYREGQRPEVNFSILFNDKNDDKFIIAVPMTKDSVIESILFYYGGLDRPHFLLVEKEEMENYILVNPHPYYDRDKNDLLYISTYNILRQSFNKSKDQTIIKWLDEFRKLRQNSSGGTRCITYLIPVVTSIDDGSDFGTFYVISWAEYSMGCGGVGNGGGTGTFGSSGGGSDGPTNPTPDPD